MPKQAKHDWPAIALDWTAGSLRQDQVALVHGVPLPTLRSAMSRAGVRYGSARPREARMLPLQTGGPPIYTPKEVETHGGCACPLSGALSDPEGEDRGKEAENEGVRRERVAPEASQVNHNPTNIKKRAEKSIELTSAGVAALVRRHRALARLLQSRLEAVAAREDLGCGATGGLAASLKALSAVARDIVSIEREAAGLAAPGRSGGEGKGGGPAVGVILLPGRLSPEQWAELYSPGGAGALPGGGRLQADAIVVTEEPEPGPGPRSGR